MAVYKTYEQVGLKEDVSSLINDITPATARSTHD